MVCSNCQTNNPEGAKFCLNCGEKLPAACPQCGTPLPPEARFCFNCGFAVQPAAEAAQVPSTAPPVSAPASPAVRAASTLIPKDFAARLEAARADHRMEGERRTVTILFCDVAGSTAMAEQLDPEEWTGIMNRAFQIMVEPVYRYEGTLARLMGDALLAFFGAPIAHEDDARRAVLVGLEIIRQMEPFRADMQRQYGLDFNLRVGINTGLVVVGAVGADLMMEYTAMGDAVNLAARMEQTAQPGTVQITENTYRQISQIFAFENLGGVEVKGKAEPIFAYRALRSHPGAVQSRGIQGLRSPLVGREKELHTLQRHLEMLRERREKRGSIVTVMGEAGLGKSRLMAEARKQASGVRWLEGRSFSYESARPYTPFADLFDRFFELTNLHDDAEKFTRLRGRLSELDPNQSGDLRPYLASLLGIQLQGEELEKVRYLPPPQLRDRVFQAVFDFLSNLAAVQPLVLAFEDLHWADPSSLDLLEYLLPLTQQAWVLILAVMRPPQPDAPSRFDETASRDYAQYYERIELAPLDESQSRELVANLLHIEDLPEKVRALILQKAEGNPFFVEEVIRSLLDAKLIVRQDDHWRATREIENISVPETLTGVITARLDRLDDDSRRVTQTAAVIGRTFALQTLQAVTSLSQGLEQVLLNLQRREFIREAERDPEPVFIFKHVLTQQTAYETLLLSRRRELHRKIAAHLEEAAPDRPDEIARHFIEAREPARALPYLVQAADQAARSYATQEAVRAYRQAQSLLTAESDPALARRVFEGLGRALTLVDDIPAAIEVYQSMLKDAAERGQVPAQVSALNKRSEIIGMRLANFGEADQILKTAEELARAHNDHGGLAEMFIIRCRVCTVTGDLDGAHLYLRESLKLGRELDEKEQMSETLAHIAQTQTFQMQFEDAFHSAQEGIRLARETGNREIQAEILSFSMAMYHFCKGDLAAARDTAREGVHIARQISASYPEALGTNFLGVIALQTGSYENALEWLTQASQAGKQSGYVYAQAMPECTLGTVYLEISPRLVDKTLEHHRMARQLMQEPGGHMAGSSGWADLGFCALALGESDAARQYFENGLTIPSPALLLYKPVYWLGLAAIAMRQGKLEAAQTWVDQAREHINSSGLQHLQPTLEMSCANLASVSGQPEKALEHFQRAADVGTTMGFRPLIIRARRGAAQILSQLGREEEARALRLRASELIQEIAMSFRDEQLRNLYIGQWAVD